MTHLSDHQQRNWAIWLQSALILSFSFYAGVTYHRMNVLEDRSGDVGKIVGKHSEKIIDLTWQMRQTIKTQARQTKILEELVRRQKNG